MKKYYEKFGLPQKYCFPLIALILGYSESSEHATRGRLDGAGIVHFNKYHHLDDNDFANLVQEYDNVKKNMGLAFFNRDIQQANIRYLDWFYRIWCKSSPELHRRKQVEMADLLKDIGFVE